MKALSRTRKMQLLGYGNEATKMTKVHLAKSD